MKNIEYILLVLVSFSPHIILGSLLHPELYKFWEVHIVNVGLTVIAIVSTIIVAYLLKFKWRPHVERIFEENLNDSLYVMFNHLYGFDARFDSYIKIIENRMGFKFTEDITGMARGYRTMNVMPPDDSEFWKEYRKWKKIEENSIEGWIKLLQNRLNELEESQSRQLGLYIHRLILHRASFYMQEGIDFIRDLQPDSIQWYTIKNRQEHALEIIKYCEKHKIPTDGWDIEFLKFKQRWEKYKDGKVM